MQHDIDQLKSALLSQQYSPITDPNSQVSTHASPLEESALQDYQPNQPRMDDSFPIIIDSAGLPEGTEEVADGSSNIASTSRPGKFNL